MSRFAIAVLLACGLSIAATAEAQTIDFSWDTCTPILADRAAPNPGGPVTAFASLTGQSQAHRGYEVMWVVGDANDGLPDAWRFDVGGCNEGFFAANPRPPAELEASCPPFVPASVVQLVITDYRFAQDGLGYPKSMGQGIFAMIYPNDTLIPDSNLRYHLVGFVLDFSHAAFGAGVPGATCGSLETPMTLSLIPHRVSYLDADGNEHFWNVGNGTITMNGAPVPASTSTWGSIKNQYRR